MNESEPPGVEDAELHLVGELLRDARPELSPLEMDRLKTGVLSRVRSRDHRGRRHAAGWRTAAVAALTVGMFACTTGVTLGIVSLADTKSAAQRQYSGASPNSPGSGILGEHGGGANLDPAGNGNGDQGYQGSQGSGVAGEQGSGAQIPAGELGGARLADADQGSLPFTGYAVFPVFGIGLLLIGAGLLLRRRST